MTGSYGFMRTFYSEVVDNQPHVADAMLFGANRVDVFGDEDLGIILAYDNAISAHGAHLGCPVAVLCIIFVSDWI